MRDRFRQFAPYARWGLFAVLVVTVVQGIGHYFLVPMHARGYQQWWIGYFNGLLHLIEGPAVILHRLAIAVSHDGHADPNASLLTLLGIPFYFVLGCYARRVWNLLGILAGRPEGPNLQRRRFLQGGLVGLGLGGLVGVGYSWLFEPRWIVVSRRKIPIRGLPPSLEGLRIAQVTDIHHGAWLSIDYVRRIVRATNALEPDLIFLTGDYVLGSRDYIRPVVNELGTLKAKIGIVAVLGNHDWYGDSLAMWTAFGYNGIPLIDNKRLIVTTDRKLVEFSYDGLALCGVDDYWRGKPDYEAAFGGLPEDMPRIVLSHNPDVSEDSRFINCGHRIDFMVSGHTHGGQIYIPFLGTPIVPSLYGQKYAKGLVQGPKCPVFVCRGLGMSVLPLRLGVPPEIAVLELTAA